MTILSVTVVTDDETGCYSQGEVDFSIHCQRLSNFLITHGAEGAAMIKSTLDELKVHVDRYLAEVAALTVSSAAQEQMERVRACAEQLAAKADKPE